MRILVGFDGSEVSHAAVTDLRRAGLPERAEALVVTSAELTTVMPAMGLVPTANGGLMIPVSGEEVRRLADQQRRHAVTTAERGGKLVSELFPGWQVRTESPGVPANAAIVDAAARWPADLVVVGTHARSAMGRLVFGSVTQSVLSHAPCSVRIARGAAPLSEIPLGFPLRLLACVDGSPESQAAVEVLCGRAWPEGSQVRLATVVDLRLLMALIDAGMTLEAAVTRAGGAASGSPVERVVQTAAGRLCDCGLDVSTAVLEGDPRHELLGEAERWEADCIFLGARGHSRFERFLIGSVSASVAARAGCSVEVVRTGSKE
jgi:nucleotide-binding universal stress UspA family protein